MILYILAWIAFQIAVVMVANREPLAVRAIARLRDIAVRVRREPVHAACTVLVGATAALFVEAHAAAVQVMLDGRNCIDPMQAPRPEPCKTVLYYLGPGDVARCPYGMTMAASRGDELGAIMVVCICGEGQ